MQIFPLFAQSDTRVRFGTVKARYFIFSRSQFSEVFSPIRFQTIGYIPWWTQIFKILWGSIIDLEPLILNHNNQEQ